jgi:hypothetical protein
MLLIDAGFKAESNNENREVNNNDSNSGPLSDDAELAGSGGNNSAPLAGTGNRNPVVVTGAGEDTVISTAGNSSNAGMIAV